MGGSRGECAIKQDKMKECPGEKGNFISWKAFKFEARKVFPIIRNSGIPNFVTISVTKDVIPSINTDVVCAPFKNVEKLNLNLKR